MQKTSTRILSVLLSVLMLLTLVPSALVSYAAEVSLNITDENGNDITEIQQLTEYKTLQLKYTTTGELPEGTTVKWESNLPLLADVDDNGKVTAYDSSKTAIIQLWLDENVRVLPLVGDKMADEIMKQLEKSGVNLDSMNDDLIVSIVRGIAGDTLADSLASALANMNVEITATIYDASGAKLASDKIKIKVQKSVVANIFPTGTHITNKKSVPLTVAVGKTVQLYAAVTPVRLKHSVKWEMGGSVFDTSSGKRATISDTGLVTFTAAGSVTVRAYDASNVAFVDTITFNVVEQKDLPVESFDIISGTKTVTDSSVSVSEGSTTQLAITNVVPAGAYTGDLTWEIADKSIAVVDASGTVTGLDGGDGLVEYSKSTTLTATAGGVSKNVTIKVSRAGVVGSISSVKIEGNSAVPNDTPTTFKANVLPSRLNTNSSVKREWGLTNPDTNEIIWATAEAPAETKLATLSSDGVFTPKSSGISEIHVRATLNDKTVEDSLTVTAGKAITDFSISGSTTVNESKTTQLAIANIAPSDYDQALLGTVVWTSSDPSIATIDANGLVKGLDSGGTAIWNTKKVTITATIGSVSKSVEITVRGNSIRHLTGVTITGNDYVIKDFPVTYTAKFSPERISVDKQRWGLTKDDGSAPWTSDWNIGDVNQKNAYASVDSNGVVTGISAGDTTLHAFGRNGVTKVDGAYVETQKNITVVEVEPVSIAFTAPTKTDYVEGSTELDLTGMEVKLTYNRADIAEYYGEEAANAYTDDQLSVPVTDYTVSSVNTSILDSVQYIIVNVVRAGKTYHAIFPITVHSKAVTSIELENPKKDYLEGDKTLDLSGLKVKANYSNAESEYVTDYTVDTSSFDPELYDVEQNITVTYTHAGRSASATFPVIVYGKPVVSVDKGDYNGGWTSKDVTFTLSSTHELDGVKYYFKTGSAGVEAPLEGNTLTVNVNSSDTYYFKAVNSKGIESDYTEGYTVMRDDIEPSFTLTPAVTELTNKSYDVTIGSLNVGASGIASVTLNGEDITASHDSFTVAENGTYTVVVTAGNGLTAEESIVINNIDKIAPTVNSITVLHKDIGGVAREVSGSFFSKADTLCRFFNKTVEITVDASDEGVSGIDKIEYRFVDENGQPTGSDWSVYDSENKPAKDPDFKGFVEARATDKAGNVSAILRSDGVVIDGTAPTDVTVSAVYGGDKEYQEGAWSATDVNITLSSEAYSGIYKYYYRVDGGEWQELSGNTFTATETGEHKYEFKAESYAALESNVTAFTVKIDRQVPVIRVSFEGTFGRWTGEGVTFNFSTEEASLSGINYYYDNGNGWTLIDSGASIEITDTTNAVYRFKAVNNAGTESYPSDSYHVMIDAKVPEITLTPEVTDVTPNPYKINISTEVGESGLREVTCNGQDITNEDSYTVSQNGTYVFTVVGKNGRVATKIFTVTNIDGDKPVLTVSSYGKTGEWTSGDVTIVLSATSNTGVTYYYDDGSGFKEMNGSVLNIAENCNKTYTFKAVNKAGVESDVSDGVVVMIDKSVPTDVTVTAACGEENVASGSLVRQDVTFTLSSSASSGVKYQYSLNGGEWTNIEGNTLTTNGSGAYNYKFRAVSGSGLVSDKSEFNVQVKICLFGDVNDDGKVDSTDYNLIVYHSLGIETLTDDQLAAADLNGDGVVDLFDASVLDLVMAGKYKAGE